MNSLNLPKDRELAVKIVDAQSAQDAKRLEMGVIGRIAGDVSHKPGNVATVVVLLSLLGAGVIWSNGGGGKLDATAFDAAIGLATLAIGYLFGKGSQ